MAKTAETLEAFNALVHEINQWVDVAAARLLADGIAVGRMSIWSDVDTGERGMMVDGVKAFTVKGELAWSGHDIWTTWHGDYNHLRLCDVRDDAAKIDAMRALVPPAAL